MQNVRSERQQPSRSSKRRTARTSAAFGRVVSDSMVEKVRKHMTGLCGYPSYRAVTNRGASSRWMTSRSSPL